MFPLGGWKAYKANVLECLRIPCPYAQAAVLEPAAQEQLADKANPAPCQQHRVLGDYEINFHF